MCLNTMGLPLNSQNSLSKAILFEAKPTQEHYGISVWFSAGYIIL